MQRRIGPVCVTACGRLEHKEEDAKIFKGNAGKGIYACCVVESPCLDAAAYGKETPENGLTGSGAVAKIEGNRRDSIAKRSF